jgi:hypothetical protein
MKGLLVSIVDVLGIFVPGFLLLVGILLFPPLTYDLSKEWPTLTLLLEAIRVNFTVFAILSAISSYVLGFIIRLYSISALQLLTFPFWAKKLKSRSQGLEKALRSALNDHALCQTLEAEAAQRAKYEVANAAPYFLFAKRIIHHGNPSLWTGAERMEAELRFVAGIFVPLLVLFCDGMWMRSTFGYVLAVVSGLAAIVVLITFPTRRIREVIYDYQMALIALKYPVRGAENEPMH